MVSPKRNKKKANPTANLKSINTTSSRRGPVRLVKLVLLGVLFLSLYSSYQWWNDHPLPFGKSRNRPILVEACPPPLPNIFVTEPPSSNHPDFRLAKKAFDKALSRFYREEGLDAIAVGVITSNGPIYESYHGHVRANESSHGQLVDRHSIFRIASISKVFTCLETLILRDRGALSLDDPISKFLPELNINAQAHSQGTDDAVGSITFRQMMSHMAGLVREHPSNQVPREWPKDLGSGDPPTFITDSYHTKEDLIKGLSEYRLIFTPNRIPAYSNVAFSLLGAANLAAAQKVEGKGAAKTYDELVKRDIFDKLGLKDTTFLASASKKANQVVPSVKSHEVDLDFGVDNPTGGQMMSLSDLSTFAQTLLNKNLNSSLLSPASMEEFLMPVYNFDDGVTSVGIPWEMRRTRLGNGRSVVELSKAGALSSQFSYFTIVPSHSLAVVILTAGKANKAPDLSRLTLEYFLPAFDRALAEASSNQLAGTWKSARSVSNSEIELNIAMIEGALYATRYTINGTDALASLNVGEATDCAPLWYLANNEFRIRPVPASDNVKTSCYLSWLTMDEYTYMNGYAVNLVRLLPHKGESTKNRLEIPALGVTLDRKW